MIYVGDRVTLKKPWGEVEVAEVGRVWVGFEYLWGAHETAKEKAEIRASARRRSGAPMRIKRKHWAKAVRDD